MGFLDCGIFTMADIVPSTYYFELQNIPYENYPNIIEAFREYILNKETMFIVYYTTYREKKLRENETQLFLNYELVDKARHKFEDEEFNAYLFKRKD